MGSTCRLLCRSKLRSSCFSLTWFVDRRRKQLIKERKKEKQAAEDGRLQIYHPGIEWKEVLLVWRAGFPLHFNSVWSVWDTWVWFWGDKWESHAFFRPGWHLRVFGSIKELSGVFARRLLTGFSGNLLHVGIQYLKQVSVLVWTSDKCPN